MVFPFSYLQKAERSGTSSQSKRAVAKRVDQLIVLMLLLVMWAVALVGSELIPWDCGVAGQNPCVFFLRIATHCVHRTKAPVFKWCTCASSSGRKTSLTVSFSIIFATITSDPAYRCNAIYSWRRNIAAPKRRSRSMCEICIFISFLLFLHIFLFGDISER